jgi:hypothetical protein
MLRCRPVFPSPRSGPSLVFLGFFAWIVIAAGRVHAAPLPPDLTDTLAHFHAAGPKGWSFLQTTESGGQSLAEYFDATQPANDRWSLRQKNGRPPTKEELADYSQGQALNSATFTAPRIQDQIDLTTAALVRRDDTRSVWRFQMKPGDDDDKTSRYMKVTVTYHQPTHTIEQVEITNTEPFSPVLAVKISETRTVMTYSLPSPESPSQLRRVTLLVRGRAFWFKTLDQDMTVTFSGHVWAWGK